MGRKWSTKVLANIKILTIVKEEINNAERKGCLNTDNVNTVWRSQTHLDDSSWEKNLCELCADVMLCAIWCYLYNLQNVKNTHGLVLILVKLQAEAKPFLTLYIFVGKISRFLRFCSLLTDFSFFNKSSKEKFGSFLLTNLESLFFLLFY